MSESFAALFEESLKRTEMRPGEVITAEVVRIEHSFVVVNAGLKSEAYVPLEEFKNDKGEARSPGRRLRVGGHRLHRKRLRRHHPVARHRQAPGFVDEPGKGPGIRRIRHRHHQRQGQGRPDRAGQWHPRLPARLAGGHPSDQGPVSVREQDPGIQGHQARPQAQQRGAEPPRRGGSQHGRRARQADGNPERRLRGAWRGQEHHRIRCVRGPGRHRRPAAHHRHGLAPCPPPERSGDRPARKSPPRSSSSTPRRTACPWVSSRWATTRGWA